MKVYIILENYTNDERWPEDYEGYRDMFRECFSDRKKAWLRMSEMAENAYEGFEEQYRDLPSYYSKPFRVEDVRDSISVHMHVSTEDYRRDEHYDFRLVEVEV